jgi:hypothetical protein
MKPGQTEATDPGSKNCSAVDNSSVPFVDVNKNELNVHNK